MKVISPASRIRPLRDLSHAPIWNQHGTGKGMVALGAVLAVFACGSGNGSGPVDRPPITHTALVRGQVLDTKGQPLDSGVVSVRIPEGVLQRAPGRASYGGGLMAADRQGRFTVQVSRIGSSGVDYPTPDTLTGYVVAVALSPKYSRLANGLHATDRVRVTLHFVPDGTPVPPSAVPNVVLHVPVP